MLLDNRVEIVCSTKAKDCGKTYPTSSGSGSYFESIRPVLCLPDAQALIYSQKLLAYMIGNDLPMEGIIEVLLIGESHLVPLYMASG